MMRYQQACLLILSITIFLGIATLIIAARIKLNSYKEPYVITSNKYTLYSDKVRELERRGFFLVTPVNEIIFQLHISPHTIGPSESDYRIGLLVDKTYIEKWLAGKKLSSESWDYTHYFTLIKMPWYISQKPEYYYDDYTGTEIVLFRNDGIILLRIQS